MCGALLPWSWSWSWVAGWSVGEAARKGPGSGFSTVIRWVSSVPSRFQGGYCHESGVECMFPAARQSNFERLRVQVRRIVLFVRGALWLSGCGARWTGGRKTRLSRLSDKAQQWDSIPYTPRGEKMCLSNGTQWTKASTQLRASEIGQYRDGIDHIGRCRQGVSIVSVFCLFPPVSEHAFFLVGSLVGLAEFWFTLLRHTWHEARSKSGRRQPGEVNHPGNGRGGDKAKHRRKDDRRARDKKARGSKC